MDKDKTITITMKDAQMVAAQCGSIICDQEEKQNGISATMKKLFEVGTYFSFMITCLFDDELRETAIKNVTEVTENTKKRSGGDLSSMLDELLGVI